VQRGKLDGHGANGVTDGRQRCFHKELLLQSCDAELQKQKQEQEQEQWWWGEGGGGGLIQKRREPLGREHSKGGRIMSQFFTALWRSQKTKKKSKTRTESRFQLQTEYLTVAGWKVTL
jgi:hypothetical protein